jgi:glycosyltransferase involved in cell wall biosynthesis
MSPYPRELVSVLIPAYNEEKAVAEIVRRVRQSLAKAKIRHEVLVVDDGSRDRTAAEAKRAGAAVVSMGENRGYGASLKAGLRHAKGQIIAMLDADGTYSPEELPALLQSLGKADMVVGARTKPHSAIPLFRRFPKRLLGLWANYLAERKIPDLNSGMRVFRKSVISRYEGLFPNGFSFTTTLTLALECHGYIVQYRPISYLKRVGVSKIRPIQDTLNFFSLVLRVVMYFKPLKIFLPLSGIILLTGLGLGVMGLAKGQPFGMATLLLLLAGVQITVLGLLADLLVKRGR